MDDISYGTDWMYADKVCPCPQRNAVPDIGFTRITTLVRHYDPRTGIYAKCEDGQSLGRIDMVHPCLGCIDRKCGLPDSMMLQIQGAT